MLASLSTLLAAAQARQYAIGAFNVYNLEGVRAVAAAAEEVHSPAMLQVHPAALRFGGLPLLALCLSAAHEASVPVAVHLDHSSTEDEIRMALAAGCSSVMADGSHLPYAENVAFTAHTVTLAHARGVDVEAELGRLSGVEDGLSVEAYEARLTDPTDAARFVAQTAVDALAVCVGNVHGRYPGTPRLDVDRLAALSAAVSVPLVLHGASGLPDALVRQAIDLGVCKLNVNTEIREAYLDAITHDIQREGCLDLLDVLRDVVAAMQDVVAAKLRLFGSAGQA